MSCELKTQIKNIIEKYNNPSESLIAILQEVQALVGFLSEESVKCITELTGIASSRILGVASFYAGFRLKPIGKYRLMVCMGTACYVKGSGEILEKITEILGLPAGSTTPDGKYSLEATRCIGACGLAPVLTINNEVYGKLTKHDMAGILEKYK